MNTNSFDGFKEEYAGESPPQPMEGLHEAGPPPFLTKTFDMVSDSTTAHVVSWSRGGRSFVVWDVEAFSNHSLPTYFKHNNFSSFVRQLNTYGFKKIDPKKWEFANESFLIGQRHLLKNITRRKALVGSPFVEAEQLRRDKHGLAAVLARMREKQKDARACLRQMELKLQGTEENQRKMMGFLAKALQNPDFALQLLEMKGKGHEEDATKKRQRPIDSGEGTSCVKIEAFDEFSDFCGFHQVSELEGLALEMQGLGRPGKEWCMTSEELGSCEKELDEGFWEELFNGGFGEEDEERDVNVLADRMGYLGSSPN